MEIETARQCLSEQDKGRKRQWQRGNASLNRTKAGNGQRGGASLNKTKKRMTMKRSYAKFYGWLKDQPIHDKTEVKETLVSNFTRGRTVHLHEMTDGEYEALCKSIESKRPSKDDGLKKWRHVCLVLLRDIGVDTSKWVHVNRYVKSYKLAGKDFKLLSIDELKGLSLQLRMIKAHST